MAKRKHMSGHKKSSIDFFVVVFNHLISLHREREKFVLSWIWNDPKVLDLFVEVVLGMETGSRDLLRNSYFNCRKYEFEVFSKNTWEEIDELFLKERLLSNMPKPVRHLLKILKCTSQNDLLTILKENEEKLICSTSYSHTWKEVVPVPANLLKAMHGKFFGEWIIHPNKLFQPAIAKVCRAFPQSSVFADIQGNLTYFYERKGNDVSIIAVHLKNALDPAAMSYMRTLLEESFAGHPKIVRQSMATLHSHMTGFGPFWQRHELHGGSKVSFYTHVEKLGKLLCNLPTAKEFEVLADRYAHSHLSELILALFMWKLPRLVTSFFNFSKPYFSSGEYEMGDLECTLGGCGPCAYQLYITKDFFSEIHKDVDASKFTLSYCSHPDGVSTTLVQFILAEHGVRIGIENGSLFGFDSSVAHGTAYRSHSHNAAYMVCLVVNSALQALT